MSDCPITGCEIDYPHKHETGAMSNATSDAQKPVEILPCPWCGREIEDFLYGVGDGDHFYSVSCFCGACGPRTRDRDSATDEWNWIVRRSDSQDVLVNRLRECVALLEMYETNPTRALVVADAKAAIAVANDKKGT